MRLSVYGPFIAIIRSRLARSSAFALLGSSALQIQALLVGLVVARTLGPSVFGIFAFVNSTVAALGVFSGTTLGITATRYIAGTRDKDPTGAGATIVGLLSVSVVLALVTGSILFFLAGSLANGVLHEPDAVGPLRLGCLLLAADAVLLTQLGALAGLEAFGGVAVVGVISFATGVPLAFVGVRLFHLDGALGSLLVSQGLAIAVAQGYLGSVCRRKSIPLWMRVRSWSGGRRVLAGFALPTLLASVLVTPAIWAVTALLAHSRGGVIQVAVLYAGLQIRAAAIFIPSVVNQTALPILTNAYANGQGSLYRRTIAATFGAVVIAGLAISIPLGVFSSSVMGLYGASFAGSSAVLVVLLISAVLDVVINVAGVVIASMGRMWSGLALNGLWFTAFIAGSIVLVSHGALGIAIAYVGSYVLHLATVGTYVAIQLRPATNQV